MKVIIEFMKIDVSEIAYLFYLSQFIKDSSTHDKKEGKSTNEIGL